MHVCAYPCLDEVLGVGSKYRVEDEMVEVGVAGRRVVVEVDEVLDVEVSADVAYILICRHDVITYT